MPSNCHCKTKCVQICKGVPPPTDEIYDQNKIVSQNDYTMERVTEKTYPLAERVDGVFGYDEDGSLNLTGGKLYNDQVQEFKVKIHGQNPSEEQDLKFDLVPQAAQITVDWFSARGMPLPPKDTVSANEGSFNRRSQRGLINIAFFYEFDPNPNGPPIRRPLPSAVDLVAVRPSFGIFQSGASSYNPDVATRDPRYTYPLRVPLTNDQKNYKKKVCCDQSIVYYDEITQQLTFNVVNENHLAYKNTNAWLDEPLPNTQPGTLVQKMHGFLGQFQLSKRDRRNNIVSSNFDDAELLVQVSKKVEVNCSQDFSLDAPSLTDTSFTVDYRTDTGLYSGALVPLFNGGSPAFDIYLINPGQSNAIAPSNDPYLTPSCHCGSGHFAAGDNPVTINIEKGSSTSFTLFLDSNLWDQFDQNLSKDFLENPPLPEQLGDFPPATTGDIAKILSNVTAHEFQHNCQHGKGIIRLVDAEAQATAIEFDQRITNGDYFTVRHDDHITFILGHANGLVSLLSTDGEVDRIMESFVGFQPRTYGGALFWRWLAKCYDPEYQVMRRANDILAETDYYDIRENSASIRNSSIGNSYRFAVKQAMQELLGQDIADVYRDFAISLSLLRNNGAIPAKYHAKFPFWMAQSAYPDARRVSYFGAQRFWWEELDTNANPSRSAQFNGFTTFFPQLLNGETKQVDLQNLSSIIYVVDKANVSQVKVKSNLGRIAVTMHQYVPNVPDINGTFIIQGPFELAVNEEKTFNVSDFNGSAGLVRLVVSNLELVDFGGPNDENNVIFNTTLDYTTGKATVTSS